MSTLTDAAAVRVNRDGAAARIVLDEPRSATRSRSPTWQGR